MSEAVNETDPNALASSTDKTVAERKETQEEKQEPKVFDADYVKELREEAARHRTEKKAEREAREKLEAQLTSLQEKVQEFEREKLTESERKQLEFEEAKSEVNKLKSEIHTTRLEAAVAKNVRKFELADADATVQLLDKSSVEYDDKGYPSNIDSVLEATLEKYPFLRAAGRKTAADTGATNPGKSRGKTLTRELIQNMSHSERVARMDEIQQWAANGYK